MSTTPILYIHFGPDAERRGNQVLHLDPWDAGAAADAWIASRFPDWDEHVTTNSEVFLLRCRLRLVEGKIPSGGLRAMFHGRNEEAMHIEFRDDGKPSQWPRGIYAEDLREVQAIRVAARARFGREETP
jgi:hypothetical protein